MSRRRLQKAVVLPDVRTKHKAFVPPQQRRGRGCLQGLLVDGIERSRRGGPPRRWSFLRERFTTPARSKAGLVHPPCNQNKDFLPLPPQNPPSFLSGLTRQSPGLGVQSAGIRFFLCAFARIPHFYAVTVTAHETHRAANSGRSKSAG